MKPAILALVIVSGLYTASAQPEVNQTFDPSQGLNENRAVCGDEVCRPIERGVCPADCAQDSGASRNSEGEDEAKQPSIAGNRAEIESGDSPPAQDTQESDPQSETNPADTGGPGVSSTDFRSVTGYVDSNPIISGIAGALVLFALGILAVALRKSSVQGQKH